MQVINWRIVDWLVVMQANVCVLWPVVCRRLGDDQVEGFREVAMIFVFDVVVYTWRKSDICSKVQEFNDPIGGKRGPRKVDKSA